MSPAIICPVGPRLLTETGNTSLMNEITSTCQNQGSSSSFTKSDRTEDPVMVRVSPKKVIDPQYTLTPPTYAICEMIILPNGDLRPVVKQWLDLIPVTRNSFTKHGFPASPATILRLGKNGFVTLVQIHPGRYALDLDSWFAYVERMRREPDFWSSATWQGRANRRAYQTSLY